MTDQNATRVAIVTGAASGIGRAVAVRLTADSYAVTGFDRSPPPNDVPVVQGDVRRRDEVEALVAGVLARHGRIDAVCNAAGVKHRGDALTTTDEAWEETFDVNVKGVLNVARAVLPTMVAQRSGAIVNIGSPSGLAEPSSLAYSGSKAAVAAITASLALAHLDDHVRVNLVVPGSTRSGMNRDRVESVTEALGRLNVAGRINEPEDVAAAVAFLLSDDAATISGARLEVGTAAGLIPLAPATSKGAGDE